MTAEETREPRKSSYLGSGEDGLADEGESQAVESNNKERMWRESLPDTFEGKRSSGSVKRRDSMRKIKSSVNRMIESLTKTRFGDCLFAKKSTLVISCVDSGRKGEIRATSTANWKSAKGLDQKVAPRLGELAPGARGSHAT